MESYIRPGCVVLSIYASMSSADWEKVSELLIVMYICSFYDSILLIACMLCFLQLEENFLQHVHSLIQKTDSDFWRNGRFLVHSGSQFVSHKDGEYHN